MTENYDELLERIVSYGGLLSVYGRADEQPTERELWLGCKDAAHVLADAAAAIRTLEEEIARLRSVLRHTHAGAAAADRGDGAGGQDR